MLLNPNSSTNEATGRTAYFRRFKHSWIQNNSRSYIYIGYKEDVDEFRDLLYEEVKANPYKKGIPYDQLLY